MRLDLEGEERRRKKKQKKDKRAVGRFFITRRATHAGREPSIGAGVLRRGEEMECVGTGRDRQRQSSSAEWGKKKKNGIWGRSTAPCAEWVFLDLKKKQKKQKKREVGH